MHNPVVLGRAPTMSEGRDAIHVAVIPAVAHKCLKPGERVGYADGRTHSDAGPRLVVDPFGYGVEEGERVWLLLPPNTVADMRHVWSCPSIPDEETTRSPEKGRDSIILKVAELCGLSYSRMMEEATYWAEESEKPYFDYTYMGTNEDYKNVTDQEWDAFWTRFQEITGKEPPPHRGGYFSCSC